MSDIVIRGMEMPKDNDYLLLIIQKGKAERIAKTIANAPTVLEASE